MPIHGLHSLDKEAPADGGVDTYAGGERSGLAISHPLAKELVEAAAAPTMSADDDEKAAVGLIVVWKDGLEVEGVFHSYEDEEVRKSMELMMKAKIPKHFFPNDEAVNVSLEVRDSNYADEARVDTGGEAAERKEGFVAAVTKKIELKAVEVNVTDEETTMLRIRLHDGQTVTQRFGITTPFDAVVQYVEGVTSMQRASFTLVAGYPPSVIHDMDSTLAALNLRNAVLQQKRL